MEICPNLLASIHVFNFMKIEKGTFLISEPFIKDPAFGRTVILIVEKNESGCIGFVLNHELNVAVSEILEHIPLSHKLYQGGPVSHNSLHFLYRGKQPVKHAVKVLPGLYWGGDFKEMTERVKNGSIEKENLRFYIGYSGWDAGQLEEEIENNTWIVTQADIEGVFEQTADKLWKQRMQALGGTFAMLANSPVDPQLN